MRMGKILQQSVAGKSAVTPPASDTTQTLLKIWSEVLNAEHIRVNDEFLELGGDSLAAMRCINRLNAEFGVEVPLERFLIDSASIADIAALLDAIRREGGSENGGPFKTTGLQSASPRPKC